MQHNPELIKAILGDPEALKAELCRRDFFFFVQEFWSVIVTEDPIWNWHIKYLCREAEKVVFRVIARIAKKYDLIINVPPGSTKSVVFSHMLPAWTWIAELPRHKYPKTYKRFSRVKQVPLDKLKIRGNDMRFITGSYSSALALESADYTRDIVQSDKFRRYFPEIEIRQDKNLKSNYKLTKGGQRFSTSVGATVTGMHGHLILIDDPLNPEKAVSDTERITANQWMDGTLSTRKVNKKITATILIMQRLHELDCTGHMLKKKGKRIKHISLPGDLSYEVKPKSAAENYVDGLLDPIRMSKKVLQEMHADLGSYGYAGQVGQDPRPREGGMFAKEWFEIVDAVPQGKRMFTVRGWDLAATDTKEAKNPNPAFTAGVKITWSDHIFYIEDVRRFRKSAHKVRRSMRNIASQDGLGTIIDFPQDPGQAGKSQAQDIAGHLVGFDVRYSTESGDKAIRANPLSAQCEAGNVKLVKGDWNQEFMDEGSFFPNSQFKDQIDAAVRAFNRILVLIRTDDGSVGGPGNSAPARNLNPEAGD